MTAKVSYLVFQKRRRAVFEQMPHNSVAFLYSGQTIIKSEDQAYPFTPNHYFYYLTGLVESNAIAVLVKQHDGSQRFILLLVPNDPKTAQWEGDRLGLEQAKQQLGADEAYPVSDFKDYLPHWITGCSHVYTLWPMPDHLHTDFNETLVKLKNGSRAGWQQPSSLSNLAHIIDEMRLIKDEVEIEYTREAVQASVNGHLAIMQTCAPGIAEYQLRAKFMQSILWHGCQEEAYPSIVAAGGNACILHYDACQEVAENGNLVLIDAGGRYQHYCADITRTLPVNGQFNAEQRAVYELVLSVQQQVIEAVKPGAVWYDLHQLSVRLIVEGLVDLGLLQGDVQQLIEQESHKQFYMHYIGHWLGLDTHDVGRYKFGDEWRKLEPGMLLTIEPGVYIRPDQTVDEKWWHIGVRIEDNILVTAQGCEVLSADLPKQPDDIEKLIQDYQYVS